eukprot:2262737-Amphidinium_carterae.1
MPSCKGNSGQSTVVLCQEHSDAGFALHALAQQLAGSTCAARTLPHRLPPVEIRPYAWTHPASVLQQLRCVRISDLCSLSSFCLFNTTCVCPAFLHIRPNPSRTQHPMYKVWHEDQDEVRMQ